MRSNSACGDFVTSVLSRPLLSCGGDGNSSKLEARARQRVQGGHIMCGYAVIAAERKTVTVHHTLAGDEAPAVPVFIRLHAYPSAAGQHARISDSHLDGHRLGSNRR